MSRLNKLKKKSVIETLATDEKDLNKYVRVTITMKESDKQVLEQFIDEQKRTSDFDVTKSLVIRKALKLIYSSKRKLDKI